MFKQKTGISGPIATRSGDHPILATEIDPVETGPAIDRTVRRVSIVGSSGSGKTYLARQLSRKRGVRHIELDNLRRFAREDGEDARTLFALAVREAVEEDSWIIDGYYRDVRRLIWQRADLVIFLDYPLTLIARQLLKRYFAKLLLPLTARKRTNDGSPGTDRMGGPDRASWRRRFARIGKTLAERREYDVMLSSPEYRGIRILKFRNPRAAFEWIESL